MTMTMGAIAAMIFVLLLTIALPVGIMLFLHRRGGAWTSFLVGAGIFILFALLLEPVVHNLVLGSSLGAAIRGNIWLYGLYGGLAAGVFEETGRLLAFRVLLKNRPEGITALSYGIGHGGAEAFLLVGLTMAANLSLALACMKGAVPPPELAEAAEALFATPAVTFLWSGLERLSAMALHVALSVLVFAAVHTGRRWLFPAAVGIHALVDFAAVTANAFLPVAATESLVLVLTALTALWAAEIYRKNLKNA